MIRTITTSICIAFSSYAFSQETIHWMNAQPTSGDISEIIPIDDDSFLMRRTNDFHHRIFLRCPDFV